MTRPGASRRNAASRREDLEALIQRADEALHESRRAGRNTVTTA